MRIFKKDFARLSAANEQAADTVNSSLTKSYASFAVTMQNHISWRLRMVDLFTQGAIVIATDAAQNEQRIRIIIPGRFDMFGYRPTFFQFSLILSIIYLLILAVGYHSWHRFHGHHTSH